jgi:DNA-binding response OmpR family regulator
MLARQTFADVRTRDLRILVIDDSAEMRRLIGAILRRFGITKITGVRDGNVALQLFAASPVSFDLIICDWMMPDITGVEVLRTVRQTDPIVPFLMVTGRAEADAVVEAIELGVSGYLKKPFSPRQLENRIRTLFARPGQGLESSP